MAVQNHSANPFFGDSNHMFWILKQNGTCFTHGTLKHKDVQCQAMFAILMKSGQKNIDKNMRKKYWRQDHGVSWSHAMSWRAILCTSKSPFRSFAQHQRIKDTAEMQCPVQAQSRPVQDRVRSASSSALKLKGDCTIAYTIRT